MTSPPRTLLVALVLAGIQAAHAAEVQVYVTTPDGRPAPDTVVVVMPQATGAAPPPATAMPVVEQRDIRFQPYVTAVTLNTTVRFINRDRFDHHVRSIPGGPLGSIASPKDFEFRLAAARGGVEPAHELKMDAPGAIALGCHLHGSMRGHIYVSPTPWVAVTNAAGRATVAGVPEGAAELRLWHPDQLVAQAQVPVQIAGGTPSVQAKINFSPRRRPPPRPRGEYDID